ncbi:MAG TPA: VIT domain-containing protein, partial [Tepidisphaeraceae bacterium]|nr:VIT domain-containing protein [Tepidisphaeraceae bacterium]
MKARIIGLIAIVAVAIGIVWVFKGCQASRRQTPEVALANKTTSESSQSPKGYAANSVGGGRAGGGSGFAFSGGGGRGGGGFGAGGFGDASGSERGSGQTWAARPNAAAAPSSPFANGQTQEAVGQTQQQAASPPIDSLIPPGPGEELWVISKPPQDPAVPRSDEPMPGQGELMARRDDAGAQKLVPVPLRHTDVHASVIGYIASVDVQQQYENPYSEKIEAVYVFPLPQNSAVNDFVMTIGSRRIRGIIRERQEAQQIYQQARAQGYVASLLTQERPNVFTQLVANIEPGKRIDIDIRYFNTLDYRDGAYEFVFPMVVGPRFNPPGYYNGIGAVPRDSYGASGQKTEVQYLAPDERSGHDISLTVDLNAGVPIEKIDSRNHQISVKRLSPTRTRVTLDPADNIPNRDFVLRYEVGGHQTRPALIAQRGEHGGYFTLMLFPPTLLSDLPRQPLEFVFTVDVSGSKSGAPLAQEKAAVRYALTHMGPQDTFQVVRFGNTAQRLFDRPQPVTHRYVKQALAWVDGFDAREGTMLIDGVHASLLFPHDPMRTRCVAFLTDGFIGNDAEAIAEVHRCLGPAHLFSFGVGQSTNRYLLDGMARMGRGAVAYLGLNDDANQIMAQYFDRVSHPALTDIGVDWANSNVHDVLPERIPDLYVGR